MLNGTIALRRTDSSIHESFEMCPVCLTKAFRYAGGFYLRHRPQFYDPRESTDTRERCDMNQLLPRLCRVLICTELTTSQAQSSSSLSGVAGPFDEDRFIRANRAVLKPLLGRLVAQLCSSVGCDSVTSRGPGEGVAEVLLRR